MPPKARTSPMKGLLSKQLASITSTLTLASQRRDKAVTKKAAWETSRASTPSPSAVSRALVPLVAQPISPNPTVRVTSVVESSHARPQRLPAVDNAHAEIARLGDKSRTEEDIFASPTQTSLRGGGSCEHNLGRLMAELDRESGSQATHTRRPHDEDVLDTLWSRLSTTLPPSTGHGKRGFDIGDTKLLPPVDILSHSSTDQTARQMKAGLLQECLPYAVALQLERAGYEWQQPKAWTRYLFSKSLSGHDPQQQKDICVLKALTALDRIKEQVFKEEALRRKAEEKARLTCRLIVTNVAADADKGDVAIAFGTLKSEIRNIDFLVERDPIRRTRVAYVDMYTREATRQAVHTIGFVFGLMIAVRLAVEGDELF